MNSVVTIFQSGSRGLSLFLGVLILGLAAGNLTVSYFEGDI